jgi:hypothetical protein
MLLSPILPCSRECIFGVVSYTILKEVTMHWCVEDMYYDFKRSCGVTQEYIDEKKQKLKEYMFPYSVEWYMNALKISGFDNIQILNAKVGFVTFYATKSTRIVELLDAA